MIELVSKNYNYEFWSIQQYIDTLETVDTSSNEIPQDIVKLLSHIVVAQRIWISRITNTSIDLQPWSRLEFEEMKVLFLENKKLFEEYFASCNEQTLSESIRYQNSTGTWFSTKIIDILYHITLHSAYHRGQLSQFFKAYSITIPTTDYIFFVRLQS